MGFRAAVVVGVLAVFGLSACGGNKAQLSVSAFPVSATIDTPVAVRVRGLANHAPARISFVGAAHDGSSFRWEIDVRADARGQVTLSNAYPYAHFDPHGRWPTRLTITVSSRVANASTHVERFFSSSVRLATEDERPDTVGFYGEWIRPPSAHHHTAILVFGGSEGGLSLPIQLLARTLAAHGYPTLALAYFGEPGIAQGLYNIPLEYFERALQWMAGQPAVDANRIVTLGVSRGQEASLLVASTFPHLVHGAVGYVGFSTIKPALTGSNAPAWTYHGRPVIGDPEREATGNDFGWIPVEKIDGPVFVVGGGDDGLAPSGLAARQIKQRMIQHHRQGITALDYPRAGHELGAVVARIISLNPIDYGVVDSPTQGRLYLGGSPEADEAALQDSWPKLLAFLDHVGASAH